MVKINLPIEQIKESYNKRFFFLKGNKSHRKCYEHYEYTMYLAYFYNLFDKGKIEIGSDIDMKPHLLRDYIVHLTALIEFALFFILTEIEASDLGGYKDKLTAILTKKELKKLSNLATVAEFFGQIPLAERSELGIYHMKEKKIALEKTSLDDLIDATKKMGYLGYDKYFTASKEDITEDNEDFYNFLTELKEVRNSIHLSKKYDLTILNDELVSAFNAKVKRFFERIGLFYAKHGITP